MTSDELAACLKELTAAGPGLREAGFVHIEAGEIKADLVPMAGSLLPIEPPKGRGEDDYDPLSDPVTYGGKPGDPLPFDDDEETD